MIETISPPDFDVSALLTCNTPHFLGSFNACLVVGEGNWGLAGYLVSWESLTGSSLRPLSMLKSGCQVEAWRIAISVSIQIPPSYYARCPSIGACWSGKLGTDPPSRLLNCVLRGWVQWGNIDENHSFFSKLLIVFDNCTLESMSSRPDLGIATEFQGVLVI